MEIPKIKICNGSNLDEESNGDELLVLLISRQEVEAGLVGDVVDRMMVLSDSRQHTENYAGAVVLQFDGYNDDPRELYQIPECVKFFRAFAEQWPYLFHFLESEISESIGVALNLLIDAKPMMSHAGTVVATFDRDLAGEQMKRLFGAMNLLHQQHELPPEARQQISHRVCQFIDGYTRLGA